MSTTHDHPRSGEELDQADEVIDAELVDEHEGPREHVQDQQQRRALARACATAARAVAGHTGPGLRHAWHLVVHWSTVQYQSDDEIRRRLVKKHLDRYLEQREETATNIRRSGKKAAKLAADAAHYGASSQEAVRLRDVSQELNRHHNAGKALAQIEFPRELVEPTAAQIRRVRTVRALARFSGIVLPLAGAAAVALVAVPAALLGVVPAVMAGAWWLGRHPIELTPRALPVDLALPELAPLGDQDGETPGDAKPYPIAKASTPAEAGEALRRAILAEGKDVESVTRTKQEPWGWSTYVAFRSGSPDDLSENRTYRNLITTLKLRRDGLLIEGDPDAGHAATVRMLERDPFTSEMVGPVPYRAPLSMSVLDEADYGVAMDATPLTYALAGLMLLMVADSGGGKSGIMLAMAEVATACRDAVVVNLDPAGTGVGALGPAITLDATHDDDLICSVLLFFLALCSARSKQRARYGWGNTWRPSAEHPAFLLFVDEWPQLSDRAKKLLIRLLLLGRKDAVWVFGGSQYGTKEYLGEAIGPKLSTQLIGAARGVDVTELLGGGALAQGYRADLIQAATLTAKNDAGQVYGHGLPGMPNRPLRYKYREIDADYAAQLGAERAKAGLPSVEHTLREAGMWDDWQELQRAARAARMEPDPVAPIVMEIREAFRLAQDPAALSVDQLSAHLREVDAKTWAQWDNRADRDRLAQVGKALRAALVAADVDLRAARLTELPGKPSGYRLADVQAVLAG